VAAAGPQCQCLSLPGRNAGRHLGRHHRAGLPRSRQAQHPAAQIVLGAAVIDDVLGLVILAVVSSLVQVGSVSVVEVSWIIAQAVLFLAGSIWIGRA
jgi:hypothetical protein